MTRSRSRRGAWWVAYAVCSVALLGALAWISLVMLDLEQGERAARHRADEDKRVALALWQMDSWLAPLLAREAARPHHEYEAYYRSTRAYGTMLNRLDPAEVLTRSSLVTYSSELFRLHFQTEPGQDVFTSPQVLGGNFRDHAEYVGLSGQQIDDNAALLQDVRDNVEPDELGPMIACAEQVVRSELTAPDPEVVEPRNAAQQVAEQVATGRRDQSRRAKSLYTAKQASSGWNDSQNVAPDSADVDVGPLVPLWIGDPAERRLYFVRRVEVGKKPRFQGFVADWTAIEARLLEQAAELIPDARLAPLDEAAITDDETGRVLATVPARLDYEPSPVPAAAGWSPARTALGITWLAVLAALVAAGLTLHKSVLFGEQRARFASTVTHELRTPLTTFRMYSEMLAEGMVSDPEQRAQYLRTLQGESGRLSALVENVLAYARLEDGRARVRREDVRFGDLPGRILPASRRRSDETGQELRTEVIGDPDATLSIDVEAVGQVVFNLVDNACKYAADAEPKRVDVTFECTADRLRVRVRDHGSGVPGSLRRTLFTPFERGPAGDDGSISGVGLGLALSRGLARDLGGDLALETVRSDGATAGASFLLDLPAGV